MTDAELIALVTAFREGMLGDDSSYGKCFMVCAPLTTLLQLYGVENKMVETQPEMNWAGDFVNHFWIKLADGRALDPTADQFDGLNLPPVYFGKRLAEIHGGDTQ